MFLEKYNGYEMFPFQPFTWTAADTFYDPPRRSGSSDFKVHTTDIGYEVRGPIVGVDPETVDVSVSGRSLSVSYKDQSRDVKRTWDLGDDIDRNAVTATAKHGLLTVVLPTKKEETRKIIVST